MLCSETFCTNQVLQKQVSLFVPIGHGFFCAAPYFPVCKLAYKNDTPCNFCTYKALKFSVRQWLQHMPVWMMRKVQT